MRRTRKAAPRKRSALWAIIYIDLMTQIMVFFVILWAVEKHQEAVEVETLGQGMGLGNQTVRMVNLPGDVLFASGQTQLSDDGRRAVDELFGDAASGVLAFDQGGLAQRRLAIHGHTDEVGDKNENFQLGYQRAWAVYQAIKRHSGEVADHVVICTHADNTPSRIVPPLAPGLTDDEKAVIREARAKNRRITIEDVVVRTPPEPAQ